MLGSLEPGGRRRAATRSAPRNDGDPSRAAPRRACKRPPSTVPRSNAPNTYGTPPARTTTTTTTTKDSLRVAALLAGGRGGTAANDELGGHGDRRLDVRALQQSEHH